MGGRTEQSQAAPGARMLRDIYEQPAVLRRLAGHADAYEAVAAEVRRRGSTTIRLVGHGSSDNAASYAVYAFGLLPGFTAFRDSISLPVYYGSQVDLGGSTVVALSQSGQTPDVIQYVESARRRGAFTVGVTNDPESALARAVEMVLPLAAGPEDAIAATKTYVAQIAALALLAACGADSRRAYVDGILDVADRLEVALPGLNAISEDLAVALRSLDRLFAIGRGPEFATAREISLKLLETCRVAAGPLTATDLSHGPVAALDDSFVVWAIATRDESLPAVREAIDRARRTGATMIVSGNAADAVGHAEHVIPVPEPEVPLLAPLLSVVPGQLFARALAVAKGLDPDRPSGITKVTMVP